MRKVMYFFGILVLCFTLISCDDAETKAFNAADQAESTNQNLEMYSFNDIGALINDELVISDTRSQQEFIVNSTNDVNRINELLNGLILTEMSSGSSKKRNMVLSYGGNNSLAFSTAPHDYQTLYINSRRYEIVGGEIEKLHAIILKHAYAGALKVIDEKYMEVLHADELLDERIRLKHFFRDTPWHTITISRYPDSVATEGRDQYVLKDRRIIEEFLRSSSISKKIEYYSVPFHISPGYVYAFESEDNQITMRVSKDGIIEYDGNIYVMNNSEILGNAYLGYELWDFPGNLLSRINYNGFIQDENGAIHIVPHHLDIIATALAELEEIELFELEGEFSQYFIYTGGQIIELRDYNGYVWVIEEDQETMFKYNEDTEEFLLDRIMGMG